MSILFFFLSLLFGWMAWNLYHPVSRSRHFSVFSFLAGWLTGELALHVIFWQVITVAFWILIGSVWGFFGALGFLVCAAAWAAMAYYYYTSGHAKEQVALGLSKGLGHNFEEQIREEFRDRFPLEPDHKLIRHPFQPRDPGVEVLKNIPFGDYGQALDIRRARTGSGDSPRPVLLQIHGGAWTENYGSKNEQGLPLMNHMAKRGWICVASSYRLSPKASFPDHVVDCKQAVVWIKDHIAEYGGDPEFIVVTGGSAGGHLSSLLALTANHAAFQPGFETRDTTVQAAVPFYGVYDCTDSHQVHPHKGLVGFLEDNILKLDLEDNREFFEEASPMFQISDRAPPFLVIHGDKDSLTPVREARIFAEELSRVSLNKVAYIELAGAQHAFDVFPSLRSEYVKHGVEKFLAWGYSEYLRHRNEPG